MTTPGSLAVILAVIAKKKPRQLMPELPQFACNHQTFGCWLGCRDSNPNCLIQNQIDTNITEYAAFAEFQKSLYSAQVKDVECLWFFRLATSWLSSPVVGCQIKCSNLAIKSVFSLLQISYPVEQFEVFEVSAGSSITARFFDPLYIRRIVEQSFEVSPGNCAANSRRIRSQRTFCSLGVDAVRLFGILALAVERFDRSETEYRALLRSRLLALGAALRLRTFRDGYPDQGLISRDLSRPVSIDRGFCIYRKGMGPM